jgi:hypothetical protein
MIAHTYKMGVWGEREIPDREGDYADAAYLDFLGYDKSSDIEIGDSDVALGFSIFHNKADDEKVLVFFNTPNRWEIIFIDDFPSMMQFLREYGPLCTCTNLDFYLQELEKIAEKTFMALHGHDSSGSCWDCDPDGMRRIEERRRQREERKNKA